MKIMEKDKTINDNPSLNVLLKFVRETKEGKFTHEIPNIANVTYQRLEIQEQTEETPGSENEVILFGIS